MRRRLLGYKRADVEQALEARASELDARDAELDELRRDIAALWLAFAQHDRTLGELRAALAPERGEPEPGAPATEDALEPRAKLESEPATTEGAGEPDPSVGRQLAELDEVLAAIEMATQTLERSYAEEIEEAEAAPEGEGSSGD